MKLTLAIIVCIGLYTNSADPSGNSANELEKKYRKFLEKAEKYAVSPEMNPAYNLRTLTWANSDSANGDFKSKCIELFEEHALAEQSSECSESCKDQAAYDTLTEEITKLFYRVDETAQPKQVKPAIDDSEAFICPICLDSVTLDTEHFMAATKCGHLFGDSCLQKWLSACPDGSKRCPTCKQPDVASDIWKLYNTEIVIVVDNKFQEERDELEEELEALNQGMEMLDNHMDCDYRLYVHRK